MGRINHAASRVHSHAAQILNNTRHTYPPPWLSTIQTTPPSEKLVRPPLQPAKRPLRRPSRLFKPVPVKYEEDKLRWEYFNDHPWELAKPRVVLENDGRDMARWDWSVELDVSLNRPKAAERDELGRTEGDWQRTANAQAARPLNGESVIQRQNWLIRHTNLSPAAAYDKARKELYRIRHYRETEQRVAREEALSTGAFFGFGPLEIGMKLEDAAYEQWKEWARQETIARRQLESAAYTGDGAEEVVSEIEEEQPILQEVAESVPGSRVGQTARGGAAIHP